LALVGKRNFLSKNLTLIKLQEEKTKKKSDFCQIMKFQRQTHFLFFAFFAYMYLNFEVKNILRKDARTASYFCYKPNSLIVVAFFKIFYTRMKFCGTWQAV